MQTDCIKKWKPTFFSLIDIKSYKIKIRYYFPQAKFSMKHVFFLFQSKLEVLFWFIESFVDFGQTCILGFGGFVS